MGAADLVPGVSGGTIAFIFGIYEKLIESIKLVSGDVPKLILKGKFKDAFSVVPFGFLVPLAVGLVVAIASLTSFLTFLLDAHPEKLWSFFFGLVLASVWVVGRRVDKWGMKEGLALCLATVVAYIIVGFVPVTTPATALYFFFSGMIAISAMILPGVSGSFLLIVMGKYEQVITMVKKFFEVISLFLSGEAQSAISLVESAGLLMLVVFALGAVLGLALFSRVLSFLFKRYESVIIAVLTGFMIGSLRKMWPWKETIETQIDRHGKVVPIVQNNVLPEHFSSQELFVVFLCFVGIFVVVILSKMKFTQKEVL